MPRNLALFDFDGTLTHKDSLFVFLRFVAGPVRFWMGMVILLPTFASLALRIISNVKAKTRLLQWFLGGQSLSHLRAQAQRFAAEQIPPILNVGMMEKLKAHQAQGDRVVVVSASADLWLKDWCAKEGIQDLLATQLEAIDGIVTGKLATPNCHGKEKVRRVQELLDIHNYDRIFAYGDSSGDREMLALAHEAWYRGNKVR